MSSPNIQADLSKQLEWELSLAGSELVSHGWYRGSLGRTSTEAALTADGQFLVRDSASQPGNYVLSCRHAGQYLHFVINRVVIQPDTVYERFQYQFEDEAYDTVADLVTSYVGSGKPISMASGARIQTPSNRKTPLLCCSSNINQIANHAATKKYSYSSSQDKLSPCCSTSSSNIYTANHTVSKNSNYNDRNSNLNLNQNPTPYSGYYNEGAGNNMPLSQYSKQYGGAMSPLDLKSNPQVSTPTESHQDYREGKNDSSDAMRREGGWNTWELSQENAPEKPARTQAPVYQASGSDSGNGSGDSAQSSAPSDTPHLGDFSRSLTKPLKREVDAQHAEDLIMKAQTLEFKQISKIMVEQFQSSLFSSPANKPLESNTLQTIKVLMRTSGPRILANHLTSIDLKMTLGENASTNNGNPLESVSGIELCLLPHGHQIRTDLIERNECLKLLIAVTILTCQSDVERADVLNDWIQLAIETKTALGNLFGFGAIMLGLCMPQVECLDAMWLTLRQRHTDAAFTFEAKLRPCFKSMNDCADPTPPNTTLPHLLPAVLLLHNTDSDKWWLNSPTSRDYAVNTSDFGLSVVAAHLDAARKFPDQVLTFRRNARAVVQEMSSLGSILDPILLDMFHTEFHIKFLWGYRGALAPAAERHNRLSQILTAMAQKYPSQSEQ